MYLIFSKIEDANARNEKGLADLNIAGGETKYRWARHQTRNLKFALKVGDGKGLSKDELAQCVKSI